MPLKPTNAATPRLLKLATAITVLAACLSTRVTAEDEKITYVDHVLPILESKCTSCHNPDEARGGLDVSSYAATMSGGSGGAIVASENPGSSRLFTLSAHTEEPVMPPRGTKMDEKELAILSAWIAGGLLETEGSTARRSQRPAVDLTSITATGKPEGPPAMPEHLILEPDVLTERPSSVPAIAHSPWAPIVAVAGQKQVLLYHSRDFDLLGVLPYPEGFPQTLSFSPNGAYLVCGGGRPGRSGNVVAWDVTTGERVIEVGREFDTVLGADVSPDLRNAIMGGPRRNIKIWDTVASEELHSIKKHTDWMLSAAYSPDGVIFATGGRGGDLYVWESATGFEFYTLNGHQEAVNSLAWRPDGNVLASASEDGQIILWEMMQGKEIKKWNAHDGGVLAIAYAPNGNIASVGRDKNVKIWNPEGNEIKTIQASEDIVLSVAYSHDNARVFTGDWAGIIKVWDVESGAELATIEPNPPSIERQLAYSEERLRILTSEIPRLEAELAALGPQIEEARTAHAARAKTLADHTKARDEAKAAADKLDAEVKSKTAAVEEGQKALETQQATAKQQAEALAAADAALKAHTEALAKATADHSARETALQTAATALEAAKAEAAKPAISAEEKAKHDALAVARAAAAKEKQAADAALADKIAERDTLAAALETSRSESAAAATKAEAAFAAVPPLETAATQARDARSKAEAALAEASRDGQTPPQELVAARDSAVEAERKATAALETGKTAQTQAAAAAKAGAEAAKAAEAALAQIAPQVASLQETQKSTLEALSQAEAALKPLRDALAAGEARAKAAAEDLAAKTAAHQGAEKARGEAKTALDAATQALAGATEKETAAKAALAQAQAAEKQAADELAKRRTSLNESRTQLASAQEGLKSAEEALVASTKQAEDAKAALDGLVQKDAETKRSIEVAKADLESSEFLAKKWQAAAINLTAHREAEQIDDMAYKLEGMMEDEEEKKSAAQLAAEARAEAEGTLAEAQSQVEQGNQALREKSTSVLERALQLVSSRAVASVREEAVLQQQPTLVETSALSDGAELEPADEDEERLAGASAVQALAHKSQNEIADEVASLRQRLLEIENVLAQTYVEATQTRSTVEQASRVAEETPKVIAERAAKEAAAAKALAEAEAERKRQEEALEAHKQRIEQLRADYLATLPPRKDDEAEAAEGAEKEE